MKRISGVAQPDADAEDDGAEPYVEEVEVGEGEGRNLQSASLDWRQSGLVTPVLNQGSCGACYTFSAAGALEGAYKQKYGVLKTFSKQ